MQERPYNKEKMKTNKITINIFVAKITKTNNRTANGC